MVAAVIIPARNEAEALGHVLAELPRQAIRQLIVVDNGSTDATAEAAVRGGAQVVSEPTPGYGRACLAGLTALDPSVDTVVFMDGDHSDYPEELSTLLEPIAQGRADLVIGSRIAQAAPGSLTPQQRFGNWLACALMRRLFNVRYTDLGPFRAIRREALERLQMVDQAFGWTVEMQAKAALHGLRIAEVPVRYRRRIGRSKISGTLRGTLMAGTTILGTVFRLARETQPQRDLVSRRCLLVFIKEPIPGRVKTRIAAELGHEDAAAMYRACAELLVGRLTSHVSETVLCVDPPEALEPVRQWLGSGWTLHAQEGADLGQRLAQATQRAFANGATRVVVIGTDSPWLQPAHIDEAFAALERAELVLGPTEDGGYYLIGLSKPCAALFEDIAWSSPQVSAQTLAKAKVLGLTVQELPRGYDLDQLADVERFLQEERSRGPLNAAVQQIEQLMTQRRLACRS